MKALLQAWLSDTTNGRIAASIAMAVVDTQTLVIAMLFGWEPTSMQLKVLMGIGAGILTMMGFDVWQYRISSGAPKA